MSVQPDLQARDHNARLNGFILITSRYSLLFLSNHKKMNPYQSLNCIRTEPPPLRPLAQPIPHNNPVPFTRPPLLVRPSQQRPPQPGPSRIVRQPEKPQYNQMQRSKEPKKFAKTLSDILKGLPPPIETFSSSDEDEDCCK